ncbi:MAG: heterodisulfide reductase-related iron-sulfur binding cluster [Pseudomonadota bacterium]|nr:heterodisulfide reductase-related iron-sulfur binding cluster [Pseudomonadota bacterium]
MPPATRSADPLVTMADRCVQCGLCLPACPTYDQARVESESPRGRIALIRAYALGTIEPTTIGDTHLDHCLGCRSCEAVCPAGVKYDELLVLGRSRQRERRGAGARQRLLETLVERPRLLRAVLGAYRRVFPALPGTMRPLPRPSGSRDVQTVPACTSPASTAWLFTGCVADSFEAGARNAMRRLCAALDIELVAPARQACCGSLHAHAGDIAGAERVMARNRDAFAGAGVVLTLASGCHDAVARSLPGITTHDSLAFLEAHADRLHFRACNERVALHLPCTQRSTVGSVPALRRLLARVPRLTVIELTAGYGCCGAAGTAMLTDSARARDYRDPLLAQLDSIGATRLLSANIGCRLHLGNGTDLPVQHPVEFLAQLLDDLRPAIDHPAPPESSP